MTQKWKFAIQHSGASLKGFISLLFRHPLFALTLLDARAHYFRSRKLKKALTTPDGFRIETANELLSYWSFRVEKECFRAAWVEDLKALPSPIVVDVGANAGVFTHLIWSLKPGTEIFAFEPLPLMNQKIQKWKQQTGANLTLFQKAVSNSCGIATFCAEGENDTSASLMTDDDTRKSFQVETVTLDSTLPSKPIFLIKIDVEGFECDVLMGAKRTIQNARFLIIEAHTQGAYEKIKSALGSDWKSEQVGSSDYWFRRLNDSPKA